MMNPEPGKSYSISSRCLCTVCGTEPAALEVSGSDPIRITAHCHGAEETKVITKRELSFTQRFFVEDTGDNGDMS